MHIYLIGFMGSGKSHWGGLLSKQINWPYFDLDQVIQDKAGKTIAEIFAQEGEAFFRQLEHDTLLALSQNKQPMILSCGGGTPCFFNNMAVMKQQGKVVWLDTAEQVLLERLQKEKSHRPLIRDIPDDELRAFIHTKRQERKAYYEQADIQLSEETLTLPALEKILFDNGK